MTKFTMFQLCRETDGYIIYYNYENNKLYGCYNLEENTKPCYSILLVQPFILAAAHFFNDWMMSRGLGGRQVVCALALMVSVIVMNLFWRSVIEKTEDIRNRRLQELPEPTDTEWESYLNLARGQFKKQIGIYIVLAVGIMGSAALFLWSGSVIFLLLFMVLYLVAYPCIQAGGPIRKYRLIKSERKG